MKPEPLPPPNPDLASAIQGIWQLLSREDYDREGRRLVDPLLGPDPLGILAFSRERFAAQFMNRRRGAAQAPVPGVAAGGTPAGVGAPAATGANNSTSVNGYDAYFGTYTVDAPAGTIATTLEGALSAVNVGMTFVRDARVAGNRLLIRLSTNATDGTPITRTLTFERVG